MRWYFALNAASIETDPMFARCAEVAALSALQRTALHPNFIFDGAPCALTARLQRMGVNVIHHRSRLSPDILRTRRDDPQWQRIAHGAFLRLDVPLIDRGNGCVLYTDCDVVFMRDPDLAGITPEVFAVAPEFTIGDYAAMNTGVMVMNLAGMRRVGRALHDFVRAGLGSFPAFDQGALRAFFDGRYDRLAETLNWKPYWGRNDAAQIVHFHGPKPPHARALLAGTGAGLPAVIKDLFAAAPEYYAEMDRVWHDYSDRAQAL